MSKKYLTYNYRCIEYSSCLKLKQYLLFVFEFTTANPVFVGWTIRPVVPADFVQEAQIATITAITITRNIIEPMIIPTRAPMDLKREIIM